MAGDLYKQYIIKCFHFPKVVVKSKCLGPITLEIWEFFYWNETKPFGCFVNLDACMFVSVLCMLVH